MAKANQHKQDNFSSQAKLYEQFRPRYPSDFYTFLSTITKDHSIAWDCGTGNGQAATGLAPFYKRIIATDLSFQQLHFAPQHNNINYIQAIAEQAPIATHSTDLITVAQAAHWFELNKFYNEVNRVLKTSGIIAIWGYGLFKVNSSIDNVINTFYKDIIGPYWPSERRFVEEKYQTLRFPYSNINPPNFSLQQEWCFHQLIGYLQTWSAVNHYQKDNNIDPIVLIRDDLKKAWGNEDKIRKIEWPIFLKIGRKE